MPAHHSTIIELIRDRPELLEALDQPRLLALLRLSVQGMEVTQGIQFYRAKEHMTDQNDHGPDNSLPLVAGKPAWVRVYLRALLGPIPNVTGTLEVYRRQSGLFWKKIATLSHAAPATAQSNPVYATQRSTLTDTLNFVIPADDMCGTLRLVATVRTPGGLSATRTETIDAGLRQTLSMRIVPVAYAGVDAGGNPLNLAAPTLATAQATAAWSTTVYPVESTPSITMVPGVTLTAPLTGAPATAGGCASSWINLNVQVAAAAAADGNLPNTFYYGLVPTGVPLGFNSGCASSGVTSGMSTGQITMAHEFGHALGFPHAPCGGVGASADPNYPAYEPYDPAATPGGSIGEYGLDVNNGNIKDPANFRDFMGYCNPDWISIYNHARAINHAMLSPRSACDDRIDFDDWRAYDPWWWLKYPYKKLLEEKLPGVRDFVDPRVPVIAVIAVLDVGGKIDVRSIVRTKAVPQVQGGRSTGLFVELLDAKAQRIAAASLRRLPSSGHGCGCGEDCEDDDGPALVMAYLPTTERGATLRIANDNGTAWSEDAPSSPAKPVELEALIDRAGRLSIRWKGDEGQSNQEVWIRHARGEEEPRVIWIARGTDRLTLDLGVLPPGKARIDAVVQGGFDAIESKPVEVEIPARGPSAAVLNPVAGQGFRAGRPLRLHGIGNACDGTRIGASGCRWLLDGEEVGKGDDVWLQTPKKPGKHTLTLEVRDNHGQAKASVPIEVQAVESGDG